MWGEPHEQRAGKDHADLALLRRAIQLQSSTFRLWYLINTPLLRQELDTAVARRWRDALAERLNREKATATSCQTPRIRQYVQSLLHDLDGDLQQLAKELSK
jgi:hypothetical protein